MPKLGLVRSYPRYRWLEAAPALQLKGGKKQQQGKAVVVVAVAEHQSTLDLNQVVQAHGSKMLLTTAQEPEMKTKIPQCHCSSAITNICLILKQIPSPTSVGIYRRK